MEHSEQFHRAPRATEHKVLISPEYEAGYQARLEGFGEYRTATPSWRAGWSDADHDLQSGVLNMRPESREGVNPQLSTFGTGWDARLCELPFAPQSNEDWKREWILADIALGMIARKGRA